VRDDAEAVSRVLPTTEPKSDAEIVIVNGGPSDDQLAAIAQHMIFGCWCPAPRRGRQMNVGALTARDRWFVFLHSDTRLPPRVIGPCASPAAIVSSELGTSATSATM
jgi:glycosyltransferase involved in cell wall biosynthesis